MTTVTNSAPNLSLGQQVASAVASAGMYVAAQEPASSFDGTPTTRFTLALPNDAPERTLELELSDSFDPTSDEFGHQLATYLAETAQRLRSTVPAALLSLSGIPLTYSDFSWPFHESTAGADTSLVHGRISLADGPDANGQPSAVQAPLHAKIAAAMTVTFREIVRAPEQPFAESFILNAIRKTLDQGQLELVKSGNRQPVPVTTRYYSARSGKFVFNDTAEPQRRAFLAAKTFWLSGVLGHGTPVWLLDPRDAQYLNTSIADLKISVEALAKEGHILLSADPAFATPSPQLLARRPEFEATRTEALAFIKPTFNEDMRRGQTNM